MNVLVDSSVWVGHFKQADAQLVSLLAAGLVVCHPSVVVEVACGTPARRGEVIDLLRRMDSLPVAAPDELLALLQCRALFGRGCGLVGIGLLASVLISGQSLLWTHDRRLDAVTAELGRAYRPTPTA
jgi:predicted nucleic acid-binding protein